MADDQLSRVFAALADPTRRDMVARLAVGDATVGELADPYDVSIQAVSKHIKVLADAGLVSQTKDAQRRPCHLEAEVFDLMTKWIERYRQQAQERYERLDAVLAEMRRQPTHQPPEPTARSSVMNTTSNRYQVSIEADPTLPIIRITRDFDATPAQLMRAHTDPELFARWVGPNGLETKILDWDATTGGRWRYVAGRDGEEYGFHGCFHEVGEDRIVQTFTFDGQPDGVALETLRFEDLGDGRTRLHAQSLVDSFEGRDQWLASGMETGVERGLRQARRPDRRAPMSSPADEHLRIAAAFTTTVEGVAPESWDKPAPPEGWVARDVVRHLVEWLPAFLQAAAAITLPKGPSVDDDPVGAWRTQTDAVQALLDDADTADREHDLPHIGRMPLGQAIDMIYTSDVFLHRWDLARATGQDETLDPDKCAVMLEGMLPMDEALRQSGQYGPRVHVPDDADVQTKLLAFIGRRP